jgi:uncharacterized protein YcgL (UPF0745 family)
MDCVIFRCGKQDEMYLYVRSDMKLDTLPEPLLKRVGKLTQVMTLSLSAKRKLARVDVMLVLQKLAEAGYYLQMPPDGHIKAHLHFGD